MIRGRSSRDNTPRGTSRSRHVEGYGCSINGGSAFGLSGTANQAAFLAQTGKSKVLAFISYGIVRYGTRRVAGEV